MTAALLSFCCSYHTMCAEKPLLDLPKTGVVTDMALPSPSASNDLVASTGAHGNGDDGRSAMESPRLLPLNPESRIVMDGPRPKELPSFPYPSLQGSQVAESEPLVYEANVEAFLPSIASAPMAPQVTGNSGADKTIANPGGDGVEHVLAVPSQLAPIPEAVEEDNITEEELLTQDSTPNSTDSASNLLAVTSTIEDARAWLPSISTTFNSTPISENMSDHDVVRSVNPSIPSSFDPPGPHSQPSPPPDEEDTGDTPSTDSTNDDGSSIFDDDYSDTSSYTTSLLSDVKNYAYENGRRYHSYREGHYVLPNDEQEQDRQDLLHHVRNLVLNGALFRAPLDKNLQRVLDIGTGTGIWAIDFADSYPSAEVIGTDLSPIQPSWVPSNLQFLVDDAESPWLFSTSRPFDFIHARDLGGAIADWPRLLRQGYEHLKPGGWIELQEFEVALKSDDNTLRLAPTLCEYLGRLHEASEAFHRPMNTAEGHRQRLLEAGFEEVRDEVYKVPSNAWSGDPVQKQIGRYNLCSLLMAVEAYSLALFTRVLGWSNNDTQVFLAGVRRDLRNPHVHTYCHLHVVYGRKP
ncbi:uncharacterized protein N7482_008739 [Penicillium canariense]|uniref:S-adenosyl-L-methionine-dependent methyltransferase n=1 Tax=Penicillium canariense TaxID=189055 RepID=A0A9W9HZ14_9EURO|nr:uncharacterized protein N7482_008739 [Penicillium canariense]KAJ5157639.1 hypothetical protein N7482_008739 [Penicillium canariense]